MDRSRAQAFEGMRGSRPRGSQPREWLRSLQQQLLVLVAVLACAYVAQAQGLTWPIQGQGLPPNGTTGVTVDVTVEVLRSINGERNSWDGVHWLHTTWRDDRAASAIQRATERWVNSSASCAMPCDSSRQAGGGCCDDVFLPHIDATNMVVLSQEAIYRYRIWVDPVDVANGNGTNGTSTAGGSMVHWVTRVTAEWQSPFDFRAYPFEHQHLLVELQVTPSLADRVYLVMGQAMFIKNTPHTKGDEVPGWYVAKVTRKLFNTSACFVGGTAMGTVTSVYTVTDDMQTVNLKPLNAASWAQLRSLPNASTIATVTSIGSAECNPKVNAEALAQYGPHILVIDIMVRRTQIYYILSTVLPLLLLDYMVFITYAMERNDLEARMGVVVTLVLAVSALQFTYNFPPSSYLNAVQQITLSSYCLFFIVAVQSMVTSHLCRLHARKRSWLALLNTANGGGNNAGGSNLAHTSSGPLSAFGRTNSSAIGLITGSTSSNADTADASKGAKAATLGALRVLRRQDSSMRSDRDTPVGGASGSHGGAVHDTITEESAFDVADHGAGQQQHREGPSMRTSSASGSQPAAHAHVQLEVVDLGGAPTHAGATRSKGAFHAAAGGGDAYGAVGGATRTSAGPGPVAEASELSSADEVPCGAQHAAGGGGSGTGLRHRTTTPAQKRQSGRCMRLRNPCGDSTQGDEDEEPPSPVAPAGQQGAGRVRRRSSLDGLPHALSRAGSTVVTKSRQLRGRIDADEAFTQLVAARLDQIFSISLLVSFTIVVAVLIFVNQQVGDHKLMLQGDAPANM